MENWTIDKIETFVFRVLQQGIVSHLTVLSILLQLS